MSNYIYLVYILSLLLFSCSHAQNTKNAKSNYTSQTDSLVPIEEFQDKRSATDKAMDAFNEIQVNGDGSMMLYLTFPNIAHKECKGEVHTFDISAKEFQDALLEVMTMNNHKFSPSKRSQLAILGSQPWSYYTVTACGTITDSSALKNDHTLPRQGTWIITEIFGVSDLLINW